MYFKYKFTFINILYNIKTKIPLIHYFLGKIKTFIISRLLITIYIIISPCFIIIYLKLYNYKHPTLTYLKLFYINKLCTLYIVHFIYNKVIFAINTLYKKTKMLGMNFKCKYGKI